MKRILGLFTLVTIFVALTLPGFAVASSWTIDADHTTVGFKIRHLMVSNVTGRFATFNGTVDANEQEITKSRVNVTIDAASIDTGVKKRDDHLRSADFFDVAKYPQLTFVSKSISKVGERLQVKGDLTIHGITKEVVLDVEGPTAESKDPWGNIRRGATAVTKINRKDFGLTWNKALETGGVLVGDEVTITLEVELVKVQAK